MLRTWMPTRALNELLHGDGRLEGSVKTEDFNAIVDELRKQLCAEADAAEEENRETLVNTQLITKAKLLRILGSKEKCRVVMDYDPARETVRFFQPGSIFDPNPETRGELY